MFGDQTTSNIVWWLNILTPCSVLFDRFDRVWSRDHVFDRVWLNLKAIKHSIKNFKHLVCSRVWWAMFCSFGQPRINQCLMRACVPRLLSGLYQLFDLCLIKHFLAVWPLTSKSACQHWSPNNVWWCLVVCPGRNIRVLFQKWQDNLFFKFCKYISRNILHLLAQ